MNFVSLAIPDREVPNSETGLAKALEDFDGRLAAGKNAVLHCRQGIGRAGLVAACLLVSKGVDPEDAVLKLSASRGTPVPETPQQRRWIDHFATVFAMTR